VIENFARLVDDDPAIALAQAHARDLYGRA
jgi:hypothetical protein